MPRMEADFDWTDVQASTPIYSKGVYELTITGVRGDAWAKRDPAGNPTSDITQRVSLRSKMVGVYDSAGKLSGEQEGKTIKDEGVENISLWVHTEGGRKQTKRQIMAVLGYNPFEPKDEVAFNKFLKDSKANLGSSLGEKEEGEGHILSLGDGWEQHIVGKNVKVHMEPETRKVEGRDDVLQQNFTRLVPVNL